RSLRSQPTHSLPTRRSSDLTHCVLRSINAVLSLESSVGAVGGRRCRGDQLAVQCPTFESKRRSLEVKHLAVVQDAVDQSGSQTRDRKSTRLNSSHVSISYAV